MIDPTEIIYFITNRPYFVVTILSNKRRIKKFIQPAASVEKGEAFFLIDRKLKMAWRKPEEPIIDGLKFITFVNIKNAIPLKVVKETKYETTAYSVKEKIVLVIKEDEEKQKIEYKDGAPEKFVEISYPPIVLYQEVDAHFIKQIAESPTTAFDKLKDWYIYIIIGGLILFWWMNQNGGKII